jgi:hypothetical protein
VARRPPDPHARVIRARTPIAGETTKRATTHAHRRAGGRPWEGLLSALRPVRVGHEAEAAQLAGHQTGVHGGAVLG